MHSFLVPLILAQGDIERGKDAAWKILIKPIFDA